MYRNHCISLLNLCQNEISLGRGVLLSPIWQIAARWKSHQESSPAQRQPAGASTAATHPRIHAARAAHRAHDNTSFGKRDVLLRLGKKKRKQVASNFKSIKKQRMGLILIYISTRIPISGTS